jgi:hypothetical protein
MVIKKMKKNNKVRSPENSEAIKKETVTSMKKIEQGGENPSFPQEFEEQRSMAIRMKPQPLVSQKKVEGK